MKRLFLIFLFILPLAYAYDYNFEINFGQQQPSGGSTLFSDPTFRGTIWAFGGNVKTIIDIADRDRDVLYLLDIHNKRAEPYRGEQISEAVEPLAESNQPFSLGVKSIQAKTCHYFLIRQDSAGRQRKERIDIGDYNIDITEYSQIYLAVDGDLLIEDCSITINNGQYDAEIFVFFKTRELPEEFIEREAYQCEANPDHRCLIIPETGEEIDLDACFVDLQIIYDAKGDPYNPDELYGVCILGQKAVDKRTRELQAETIEILKRKQPDQNAEQAQSPVPTKEEITSGVLAGLAPMLDEYVGSVLLIAAIILVVGIVAWFYMRYERSKFSRLGRLASLFGEEAKPQVQLPKEPEKKELAKREEVTDLTKGNELIEALEEQEILKEEKKQFAAMQFFNKLKKGLHG